MTSPNNYSFPISWGKTINQISKVGLAWSGFNVQPSNGYLSYEANITDITSTGATVNIFPQHTNPESPISLLQFQVIVLTECSLDKIELITFGKKGLK